MESRSSNVRGRQYRVKSEDSPQETVPVVEKETPKTVRIRLMKHVNLNITGKSTGKVYRFSGAGSEVAVDIEDLEELMKRKSGACGGCPSSVGPTPYFELV